MCDVILYPAILYGTLLLRYFTVITLRVVPTLWAATARSAAKVCLSRTLITTEQVVSLRLPCNSSKQATVMMIQLKNVFSSLLRALDSV